jgi:hypothetical protein
MIVLFMSLFVPVISLALTVDIIQNGKDNFIVKIGREVSKIQPMESVLTHLGQLRSHPAAIGVVSFGFLILVLAPTMLVASKLLIDASGDLAAAIPNLLMILKLK